MTSFSLTILGSSSALPTSQRFPTAQIVTLSEQFYLIDCGEGTQMQLRKFRFRIGKINHIFISHLHGDHYFGIFGLISTMQLLNRKGDLHIYGPKGLKDTVGYQLDHFDKLSFPVIFHEIETNCICKIYESSKLIVESIPLKHRVSTSGFIFREKPKQLNIQKAAIEKYNLSIREIVQLKNGENITRENGTTILYKDCTLAPENPRAYAYCSDTLYKEDIIPQLTNIDLLYHEATYMNDLAARAKETFHTTALQAATIAKMADVKKLVIGHFSARYKSSKELVEEARSIFPETYAAEDGLSFEI